MIRPVRVAVDAMGGDRAPEEIVAGALAAATDDVTPVLYGPRDVLEPLAPSLSIVHAEQVVANARAQPPERWAFEYFAGTPYQWGGVTPWGVDCSGLVQTTFAARGIALPRDSAQQANQGASVPLDGIRPGDLLFFRGESTSRITHVAFSGDGDTLVQSTLACGGTLVEPWHPGTRAATLRERLVAVRRLEGR
jgi:gamma-D-glutamyl-L-lysine dipeptidyl-peptidase